MTPKCFISYSWTNPDHIQWVVELASELVEAGVDVSIDKWDLREGHDANAYMERMVSDPSITKVIIICDRTYVEKTNAREGGVGTEAQIISQQVYSKTDQNKFVAVIKETDQDGKPCVPAYYASRIYIDLSSTNDYEINFERLLRWLFDQPLHIKPALGSPPKYITEPQTISIGNPTHFRRALDALRNSKPHARGAVDEYLKSYATAMASLRLPRDRVNDDAIFESIEQTEHSKTLFIELISCAIRYLDPSDLRKAIHSFFECLIPLMEPPEGTSTYSSWDSDNLSFSIHELFLSVIALALDEECFQIASHLTGRGYIYTSFRSQASYLTYSTFNRGVESLKNRNKRLGLRKHSLHADLLEQRCRGTQIKFLSLLQADVVLYLRSRFIAMKSNAVHPMEIWNPETVALPYGRVSVLPAFAKSASKDYFQRLSPVLGIASSVEFTTLMKKLEGERVFGGDFGRLANPHFMVGIERIASQP